MCKCITYKYSEIFDNATVVKQKSFLQEDTICIYIYIHATYISDLYPAFHP